MLQGESDSTNLDKMVYWESRYDHVTLLAESRSRRLASIFNLKIGHKLISGEILLLSLTRISEAADGLKGRVPPH